MHGEIFIVLLIIAAIGGLPLISLILIINIMSKLSRLNSETAAKLSSIERMLRALKEAPPQTTEAQEKKKEETPLKTRASETHAPSQSKAKEESPASASRIELAPGIAIIEEQTTESEKVEKSTSAPELSIYGIPKNKEGTAKKSTPAPQPQSDFERNALEILRKIWTWIVVGEEHRVKGVSLEYAVASTWLLRIAIVIILAGVSFFLKYSIENNYLGPVGRVTISFLAGIGLMVWGLKLANKKYHLIAQGLLGAGIATLYFSAFASSMLYHLVPGILAFALMVLVTGAACAVAMAINSPLMAILGTIGGYLTPVLLSTGEKNLPGLFAYMAMLGGGLIWVARHRDWKVLNFLSFAFTCALYYGSMSKFYDKALDYPVAMGFLALFFLIFSFIPILYNIVHSQKSTLIELIFMFLNAALFFSVSYSLTEQLYGREWTAAISIALAGFYLAQAGWHLKKGLKDRGLLVILSAFAAFFITFTMPLLLSGRWITASWSIQAFLFLWMSRKLDGNFIRVLAYSVYAVAALRLAIIDFPLNFGSGSMQDYWTNIVSRLCTFGIFAGSAAGAWALMRKDKKETKEASGLKVDPSADTGELLKGKTAASIFICAALGMLFFYLHFELRSFSLALYPAMQAPLLTAIWIVASVLALLRFLNTRSTAMATIATLLGAGIIIKLFFFDLFFWRLNLESFSYSCAHSWETALMRGLDFIPAIAALAFGFWVSLKSEKRQEASFFGSISIATLFLYLTLETKTLMGIELPGFRDGAVSVLWGVFALALVTSGMKWNIKAMRYAGLALFLVTALKIFLFDLASLSQPWRIAAFIGLGFATLAAAFAYVKCRSIFESPSTEKEELKK
ncbi:MAG: hypothetical protein A2X49_13950 [Lentisphaerae bacterium GWF2_52_8]|nr:MAG: hypothetical protein A2X49_13950 [Lentisphaerae bacterium GWF2_52_8]